MTMTLHPDTSSFLHVRVMIGKVVFYIRSF